MCVERNLVRHICRCDGDVNNSTRENDANNASIWCANTYTYDNLSYIYT